MLRNALILDTDGGVDDAQALMMLIAGGRVPEAITTVFGNVGLAAATRNILATLAVMDCTVGVHAGAAQPMVQPLIDARHIHGEDGLGGAPRPPVQALPAGHDGVGWLIARLRAAATAGTRVDILMIGPLTNLALALRLDPAIVAGIGQLTIMGGTLYGRGNTTPAAEFNICADPEAAAVVFGAAIETLVVPWEPCTTHFIDGAATDALFAGLPGTPATVFARALADHARRVSVGRGVGDVLRFVDPLAAAVVIDPGLMTASVTASVDVALAPGITRGMTVVDPSLRLGTPPVTLLETARLNGVTALYARSVGHGRA